MGEQEMNREKEQAMPRAEKKKSGLMTAGMVLGIIGICTSFIPIVNNMSFVMGILALIFGAIGVAKKQGAKAITALVCGVLAIVITLTMQAAFVDAVDDAVDELDEELGYLDGSKTQEILDKHLQVSVGKFSVKHGEYMDTTELIVEIKNKGSEKKSFQIEIEAVDEKGNRIDTDYIYANDLGAGQGQEFKLFTYVADEDLAAMQSATFRVLEVSMY